MSIFKYTKIFKCLYVSFFNDYISVGGVNIDEETLTFEDGIIFCKHLYQCAIHKTMNGDPEEWIIFYKTYDYLDKLGYHFDTKDLENVLFKLNLDNIYKKI
jgi:hypothetical protein